MLLQERGNKIFLFNIFFVILFETKKPAKIRGRLFLLCKGSFNTRKFEVVKI